MGKKTLFSLWFPSRESTYKYSVLPMKGSCFYKDNNSSDKSKKSDDDKDITSDNYNNSNMKVI